MKNIRYTSTIKSKPFLYYQSKAIARLVHKNLDQKEIIEKCLDEDVIGIDSKIRVHEVTSKIYKRISYLDDYLTERFIKADTATSKFILLYAIMREDRLFFEFMFEVYQDALINSKEYLTTDDFYIFFDIKKESITTVRNWSQITVADIIKAYRNVLKESGFGFKNKNKINLITPIIDPDVVKHIIKKGHSPYIDCVFDRGEEL